MVFKVKAPSGILELPAEKLSQEAFAEFGSVIEHPGSDFVSALNPAALPSNIAIANQGSALKICDVTHMVDLYINAPSKVPSKAVMNMFACTPRKLERGRFPVKILERHPFTSQTFIPLGLAGAEMETAYLVIVAPRNTGAGSAEEREMPDLARAKAFIAQGSQAVTYAANTWHAPMVVIGQKRLDFVVVQFANGVGLEDCEEVVVESTGAANIAVAVPAVYQVERLPSKL